MEPPEVVVSALVSHVGGCESALAVKPLTVHRSNASQKSHHLRNGIVPGIVRWCR